MANNYYTFYDGNLWKHHVEDINRNTFYTEGFTESSITPVFNNNPDTVKIFNTLSYSGTQSKTTKNLSDNNYHNLADKEGWYVDHVVTNIQEGTLGEFIEKEGKWFNYIKGVQTDKSIEPLDGVFNYQGIGVSNNVS